MSETKPTIFIVDDDASVRHSTELMLKTVGFAVKTFVSAQDFLNANLQEGPGCLILDVRMPGMSGIELQEKLVSAKMPLPVIFITGHGTVPMSVRAMKAGAVDFLQKPFEEQDLLDAINRAIAQQLERKSKKDEAGELQQRLKVLTSREHEVFSLLVTGMANKEIAYKLGKSERTVKAHRAQIMEKMHAGSLADLIHFAEMLKTHQPDQQSPPHQSTISLPHSTIDSWFHQNYLLKKGMVLRLSISKVVRPLTKDPNGGSVSCGSNEAAQGDAEGL